MEFRRKKLLMGGRGRGMGGYSGISFPTPVFWAPLDDAGAGIVNTTLRNGTGSATFTRATVAWTKLSTGLWKQVASGSPRSHYLGANTAVGAYGGFFSEAAGIQLVTPTASIRDMTDAAWVKSAVLMSIAGTVVGIDGTTAASGVECDVAGNGTIVQTLTAVASTRTYSCFIKRLVGTGTIEIGQWASAGAASWSVDVTSLINSSTFTRVSVTGSFLDAAFGIRIVTAGDQIAVDFNQFEAGSVPTSPMASAGAARNMDLLTFPSAGNISSTVGTAFAEITPFQIKNTGAAKGIFGGDNAVSAPMYLSSTTALLSIYDGAQRTFGDPGLPLTSFVRVAINWGGTSTNGSINGANAASAGFDGNLNMGATLAIGNLATGTSALTGTIRNAKLWDTQFSALNMAVISR